MCMVVILLLTAILNLTSSHEGKDFVLGVLENFPEEDSYPIVRLYITSSATEETDVILTVPDFSQSFSWSPNKMTNVQIRLGPLERIVHELPYDAHMLGNGISNKGIRVSSTSPVGLYVQSIGLTTGEAYLVLPTSSLGTEHIVISSNHSHCSSTMSSIGIVASVDLTVVEVELPSEQTQVDYVGYGAYRHGNKIQMILNALQTYQLQTTDDLSGSIIRSSHAIAVVSGFAAAASQDCSGVFSIEMLPASKHLGTDFFLPPFSTIENRFALVARYDYTSIEVTTLTDNLFTWRFSLNKAQLRQFRLQQDRVTFIRAFKPVLLAQFAKNALAVLPSVSQWSDHYVTAQFTPYREETNIKQMLNIILPSSEISNVILSSINGSLPVKVTTLSRIPKTMYSLLSLDVPIEAKIISIKNGAVFYGVGYYSSTSLCVAVPLGIVKYLSIRDGDIMHYTLPDATTTSYIETEYSTAYKTTAVDNNDVLDITVGSRSADSLVTLNNKHSLSEYEFLYTHRNNDEFVTEGINEYTNFPLTLKEYLKSTLDKSPTNFGMNYITTSPSHKTLQTTPDPPQTSSSPLIHTDSTDVTSTSKIQKTVSINTSPMQQTTSPVSSLSNTSNSKSTKDQSYLEDILNGATDPFEFNPYSLTPNVIVSNNSMLTDSATDDQNNKYTTEQEYGSLSMDFTSVYKIGSTPKEVLTWISTQSDSPDSPVSGTNIIKDVPDEVTSEPLTQTSYTQGDSTSFLNSIQNNELTTSHRFGQTIEPYNGHVSQSSVDYDNVGMKTTEAFTMHEETSSVMADVKQTPSDLENMQHKLETHSTETQTAPGSLPDHGKLFTIVGLGQFTTHLSLKKDVATKITGSISTEMFVTRYNNQPASAMHSDITTIGFNSDGSDNNVSVGVSATTKVLQQEQMYTGNVSEFHTDAITKIPEIANVSTPVPGISTGSLLYELLNATTSFTPQSTDAVFQSSKIHTHIYNKTDGPTSQEIKLTTLSSGSDKQYVSKHEYTSIETSSTKMLTFKDMTTNPLNGFVADTIDTSFHVESTISYDQTTVSTTVNATKIGMENTESTNNTTTNTNEFTSQRSNQDNGHSATTTQSSQTDMSLLSLITTPVNHIKTTAGTFHQSTLDYVKTVQVVDDFIALNLSSDFFTYFTPMEADETTPPIEELTTVSIFPLQNSTTTDNYNSGSSDYTIAESSPTRDQYQINAKENNTATKSYNATNEEYSTTEKYSFATDHNYFSIDQLFNYSSNHFSSASDSYNTITEPLRSITDQYISATDQYTNARKQSISTTDQSNDITDQNNVITDQSNVITDQSNVITDRSRSTTDQSEQTTAGMEQINTDQYASSVASQYSSQAYQYHDKNYQYSTANPNSNVDASSPDVYHTTAQPDLTRYASSQSDDKLVTTPSSSSFARLQETSTNFETTLDITKPDKSITVLTVIHKQPTTIIDAITYKSNTERYSEIKIFTNSAEDFITTETSEGSSVRFPYHSNESFTWRTFRSDTVTVEGVTSFTSSATAKAVENNEPERDNTKHLVIILFITIPLGLVFMCCLCLTFKATFGQCKCMKSEKILGKTKHSSIVTPLKVGHKPPRPQKHDSLVFIDPLVLKHYYETTYNDIYNRKGQNNKNVNKPVLNSKISNGIIPSGKQYPPLITLSEFYANKVRADLSNSLTPHSEDQGTKSLSKISVHFKHKQKGKIHPQDGVAGCTLSIQNEVASRKRERKASETKLKPKDDMKIKGTK